MTRFDLRSCFVHSSREAVALCLECRNAFCRECVVDHDGRLICAACLRRLQAHRSSEHPRLRSIVQIAGMAAAVLICWTLFYIAGRALLILEPARHSFSADQREQP